MGKLCYFWLLLKKPHRHSSFGWFSAELWLPCGPEANFFRASRLAWERGFLKIIVEPDWETEFHPLGRRSRFCENCSILCRFCVLWVRHLYFSLYFLIPPTHPIILTYYMNGLLCSSIEKVLPSESLECVTQSKLKWHMASRSCGVGKGLRFTHSL